MKSVLKHAIRCVGIHPFQLSSETPVIVQGFTGKQGTFHAEQCIEYGTNIVGGVNPAKAGTEHIGLPVFGSVGDAITETGATCSLVFVPPAFCYDALKEAVEAEIELLVAITEGIPQIDVLNILNLIEDHGNVTTLLGPNCPGLIVPGEAKVGIMPGDVHSPGSVGIVSRSGTLTYEAVYQTTEFGYGQSIVVGIGGDPFKGTDFIDVLDFLLKDENTDYIVMIGEIGGEDEEKACQFLLDHEIKKPTVGYICGKTAPPGRRMGHAGAVISGGKGDAESKIKAMNEAGIAVANSPAEIGKTLHELLNN